ncbi:hypothetical protein [Halococcoides cellulosivorans]|uniref:Uncharacterized protein n=1 Tax=Halococcoides cellulosivorans TaxID=1679096 RepID=A0A2R4WXY7_9EURY|nr:hypothetical protein [Halococcoides cellulosivorans]AWB26380.1 hypothetical protein HARCEL1_00915 [Halococcoides cellulosivorans]
MDELRDAIESFGELGLDGVFRWVLRVIGLVAIVGGIGLVVVTELGPMLPTALVLGGLIALVFPDPLLTLAEVAG